MVFKRRERPFAGWQALESAVISLSLAAQGVLLGNQWKDWGEASELSPAGNWDLPQANPTRGLKEATPQPTND